MYHEIKTLKNSLPLPKLIERFYPFNQEELFFLAKQKSSFDYISYNHKINWTPEFIGKLKNVLNWRIFTANSSVPWQMITPKYESFISWAEMSDNIAFNWKVEYLEKYCNEIDWPALSKSNFPFTDEVLFQFRDFWDWGALSNNQNIPWSEELLERFSNYWDWSNLSSNPALPFTKQLIKKFHDLWNFRMMSSNPRLVSDKFLPLLERFTSLDYELISFYKNDFSAEFLENNADKLDWQELSKNEHLPWSKDFFNYFLDRWHFVEMSGNIKIPWSNELVEKYENEWNWSGEKCGKDGWCLNLSSNEGLPWSFDFIERYSHKLEWGQFIYNPEENFHEVIDGVTCIKKIDWTVEKMAKYAGHFHEYFLLNNINFYKAIEKDIGRENIFNFYLAI